METEKKWEMKSINLHQTFYIGRYDGISGQAEGKKKKRGGRQEASEGEHGEGI